MLGRKAIHHKAKAGIKRKWQVEIDQSDKESGSSEDEKEKKEEKVKSDAEESDRPVEKDPDDDKTLSDMEEEIKKDDLLDDNESDMECDKSDNDVDEASQSAENAGPKKKKKAFAWMDSDEEGDDDEEDDDAVVQAQVTGTWCPGRLDADSIDMGRRISGAQKLPDLFDLLDNMEEELSSYLIVCAIKKIVVLYNRRLTEKNELFNLEEHPGFQRFKKAAFAYIDNDEARHKFLPHELALFAGGMASVATPSASIYRMIAIEASPRLNAFSPAMLAELCWGVSQARVSVPDFFEKAAECAQARFWAMSFDDIGKFLTALATMNVHDKHFMQALESHLKIRLGVLSAEDVEHARLIGDKYGACFDADALPWRFAPGSGVEVAAGFAKLGVYNADVVSALARQLTPRLMDLKAEQLQDLEDAYDTMRHDLDVDFLRALRKARGSKKPPNFFRKPGGTADYRYSK